MIIISPFSRPLRSGKVNPKNYPFWDAVVRSLREQGFKTLQIGSSGEQKIGCDEELFDAKLSDITTKLYECQTWASVDNFFPHLAAHHYKKGVVVWGVSDPKRFGYPRNTNLLKDAKNLRAKQYDVWDAIDFSADVFVSPETVVSAIVDLVNKGADVPLPDATSIVQLNDDIYDGFSYIMGKKNPSNIKQEHHLMHCSKCDKQSWLTHDPDGWTAENKTIEVARCPHCRKLYWIGGSKPPFISSAVGYPIIPTSILI